MSETQLSTIDHPRGALADLRTAALSLPLERIELALAEYSEKRNAFRDWLKAQLVSGVHYGFPPGCEPKTQLVNGETHYGVWMKGAYKYFPPSQWQPKPSFYKAGADFVCDLLGVRDEYKADLDGWKQLGEPPGVFVYACYLYSRSTGELLGEGRGVRKVGQKGGDENNGIKMAKKSAKCDAVLNTWGLADLFTQDLEDMPASPELHDNPEHDEEAPKAGTRQERKKPTGPKPGPAPFQIAETIAEWKSQRHDSEATPEHWANWVQRVTGRKFNVKASPEWTAVDYEKVHDALERNIA